MQAPLTNILIKIFARGFYKVNSGLLIFLFVVLISYCFFINTLGDVKLLKPGEETHFQFLIILTFISSPAIMLFFFIAWAFYTFKSWQFVSSQLDLEDNQFLFYSLASATKPKQFKAWLYAQFIISLPFIIFAAISAVVGLFLHHYVMVLAVLFFTSLLVVVSALVYVRKLNNLIPEKQQTELTLTRGWRKPLPGLFIYYVFYRHKLSLVLTKLLSYIAILTMLFLLADTTSNNLRAMSLCTITIVLAHAVLVYQQQKFQLTYLSLTGNLPYNILQRYLQHLVTYAILLLPESIWLLFKFDVLTAAGLILLMLSIAMLFHSLLYSIGLEMRRYLPWLFCIFLILSVCVLFGLAWMLIPVCFVTSYLSFWANYYKLSLI